MIYSFFLIRLALYSPQKRIMMMEISFFLFLNQLGDEFGVWISSFKESEKSLGCINTSVGCHLRISRHEYLNIATEYSKEKCKYCLGLIQCSFMAETLPWRHATVTLVSLTVVSLFSTCAHTLLPFIYLLHNYVLIVRFKSLRPHWKSPNLCI